MKKRIAILSSDDAHHRYLAALLESRFEVVARIIEPAESQRARLLRARRYIDYTFALYHQARRLAFGLDAYRLGYFGDAPADDRASRARTLVVDWINEPSVVALLAETRPDITIVLGTSLLRRETLKAAGGVVLNVHAGHLPDYRGSHGFFFALYRRDFEKIGSTIHFVDQGIDTGDIVEVVKPSIRPSDDAETLQCRADKLAFHRLVHWLEHLERGGLLPRRQQERRGQLNRTRDRTPYHDLAFWVRRRANKVVLPAAPDMGSASAPRERLAKEPAPARPS